MKRSEEEEREEEKRRRGEKEMEKIKTNIEGLGEWEKCEMRRGEKAGANNRGGKREEKKVSDRAGESERMREERK